MLASKELVVKSNRLIEASYRLTLIEQQIILYAICRSREEQVGISSDIPVRIKAMDFANHFGTNPERVYAQLKSAMDTLFERHVVIHDIDTDTLLPRVNKVRWISKASYIDGAGHIQLIFSSDVIGYITRLESEFTSYRLEKIGAMSSIHAVRLYEILVQYLNIGKRDIEIEWLKNALQITEGYTRISDLKKRVIEVSVKQINEHSDISVSYSQEKTGRNITHLAFKIKSKETKKAAPKKSNHESSKPSHASHIETPTSKKSTRSVMPDGLADNLKNMLK